jgi:hypothetical protein
MGGGQATRAAAALEAATIIFSKGGGARVRPTASTPIPWRGGGEGGGDGGGNGFDELPLGVVMAIVQHLIGRGRAGGGLVGVGAWEGLEYVLMLARVRKDLSIVLSPGRFYCYCHTPAPSSYFRKRYIYKYVYINIYICIYI